MLFTYEELSGRIEGEAMKLPCLTLHAHWAAAIFTLGKDVENRSWSTPHRGPLAIHAGSSRRLDREICDELGLDPDKVICGVIIGTVELIDIVRDSRSRWAMPGHYHWILANPRPLDHPIPHKGSQTLHTVTLRNVRYRA